MNYNKFADKYGFFLWKKNLKILEKDIGCHFGTNQFHNDKHVYRFLNKLDKAGANNIEFLDCESFRFEVHIENWFDISKILLKEHYVMTEIKIGKLKRNKDIYRVTI